MNWYTFYAIKGAKKERVEVRAMDWQDACDFMEMWIDDHGYESYYERDDASW